MIEPSGDITLDRAADLYLPFAWQDDQGAPIDISQADLVLKVKSGPSLTPGFDPENPLGRLFHFNEAFAAQISASGREYMILLAEGEDHTVLVRAKIKAIGWVE